MLVLEQGRKLRESNDNDLGELSAYMTAYCARNGIKAQGGEEESVWLITEVLSAVERNFPYNTIEEVIKAFEMYEGRKLGSFYPIFNVGHVMGIIENFLEYKRIELEAEARSQKLYQEPEKQPPTPEEEISIFLGILKRCWEYAERESYDDLSGAFVFDKFKEIKVVNLSKEQIEEVRNLASESIMQDAIQKSTREFVKKVINQSSDVDSAFKFRCRCIATTVQIKNWIKEGKTFDDTSILITEKWLHPQP